MAIIRVKFQKGDTLKYISHLDLLRLFQRAFRRADIPVKYSQGYNPHPKFSLATALSLGVTSDGEYMDIELEERIKEKDFIEKLNSVLPLGVKILKAKYVDESNSLMSLIRWSTYIIEIKLDKCISQEEIDNIIEEFLNKEEIKITKEKNKKGNIVKNVINIRNYIKDLVLLLYEDSRIILKTTLRTGSTGNLKPTEFINLFSETTGLEIKDDNVNIHRLELFIEKDDRIVTPI